MCWKAISGEVWGHKEFHDFWHSYVPLDARQHAIKRGAVRLSKALRKAGFKPFVAYPSGAFLVPLRDNQFDMNLEKLKPLLPARFGVLPLTPTNWYTKLVLFQKLASPIHMWQILGVQRGDVPFIKKDLFYRAVFSEAQLRSFIKDAAMLEVILSRKPPERGMEKFLWQQGIL